MIKIPETCPCCGSALERVKMQLFCRNKDCSARLAKQIESYCKKRRIKGLAEKSIEALNISSIPEIYYLTEEYLVDTIGKNGRKIFIEIQNSLDTTISELLGSLSIPLIGKTTAERINGKSLLDLDYSALPNKAKENFKQFLQSDLYKDLSNIQFNIISDTKSVGGVKVCLSGRFDKTKRELKYELEKQGYQVVDNLTKDVEILFVADKSSTSSKITKATKLNIKIEEL